MFQGQDNLSTLNHGHTMRRKESVEQNYFMFRVNFSRSKFLVFPALSTMNIENFEVSKPRRNFFSWPTTTNWVSRRCSRVRGIGCPSSRGRTMRREKKNPEHKNVKTYTWGGVWHVQQLFNALGIKISWHSVFVAFFVHQKSWCMLVFQFVWIVVTPIDG